MAQETTRRATGPTGNGSVALFIDWDNFAIGLRQEMPERPADVGPILRWSRRFGSLTFCRAYGEWRDPAERLAIYNAGVEVVYAPVLPLGGSLMARDGGGAKSLADTAMAVDVTETLSLVPTLTTLILATSDKDLIPVLRFAQRRGLQAVVVGSDRTAGALRELADEFISYRQLLDQEGGAPQQISRPVTVPPMRYPRAPRATVTPIGSGMSTALPPPSRSGRAPTVHAPTPITTGTSTATAVAPVASSAGSVFTGEAEDAGAAARRRRRGGRRRRPGELGGGDEAAPISVSASADAPASSTTDSGVEDPEPPVLAAEAETTAPAPSSPDLAGAPPTPAPSRLAEPNPVGAAAGIPASPGAVYPADEPAPAPRERQAPGPGMRALESSADTSADTSASPRNGPRIAGAGGDPGVFSAPAGQRGPVVLPGERLRRLAPSTGAIPGREAAPQPERPAPSASAAPAAPPATESLAEAEAALPGPIAEAAGATDAEPAETGGEPAAARRGRRRGGRGRGQAGDAEAVNGAAAASSAPATGDESVAAASVASAPDSAAEQGSDGEADAGSPARRSRRRGGRSH